MCDRSTSVHEKRFTTLAAKFTLAGYALIKTDPATGALCYVTRRRSTRPLHSLDQAEQFLHQIEGAK